MNRPTITTAIQALLAAKTWGLVLRQRCRGRGQRQRHEPELERFHPDLPG
jgi:hypothetical protein